MYSLIKVVSRQTTYVQVSWIFVVSLHHIAQDSDH